MTALGEFRGWGLGRGAVGRRWVVAGLNQFFTRASGLPGPRLRSKVRSQREFRPAPVVHESKRETRPPTI
jgi:hypothetical protein